MLNNPKKYLVKKILTRACADLVWIDVHGTDGRRIACINEKKAIGMQVQEGDIILLNLCKTPNNNKPKKM
ncbi:hypothetical protein CL633_03390 [bacterium]|nr:hypothetical protein [bacterium]|tara:strand:+ start:9706 stop:9915 length:210 start_codon:yes stop_codon:yes gene_type:complete